MTFQGTKANYIVAQASFRDGADDLEDEEDNPDEEEEEKEEGKIYNLEIFLYFFFKMMKIKKTHFQFQLGSHQ